MKKSTKVWILIAISLIVFGCIMFAVAMTKNHWNFRELNTVNYETNTYQIDEGFSNISLLTDTADILFVPSDDGMCKVICYEPDNMKHAIATSDGTLTINVTDKREWYDYIGITFGSPKLTLYLPEVEYDSLLIKEDTGNIAIPKDFKFKNIDITTSTGDITVHGVTCEENMKLNVSTGKINLADIKCKNLLSDGDTGDFSLKDVISTEKISIQRSTGDVKFDSCDAAEISVITDTGDVTGSFLSEKSFITNTSTGDINVPESSTGGKCEITTSTGDISIK